MNNDEIAQKVLSKLDDLNVEIKALRSDARDNKQNIALLNLQMGTNVKTIKAMQTDLSDLKSDVNTLKSDVSILKTDVSELKSDVSELKTDVSELKTDVSELKTDVSELKTDVNELKSDVATLKTDVRRLEVLHEETDDKINQILETYAPTIEKTVSLERNDQIQDEQIEYHEHRIRFLEEKTA